MALIHSDGCNKQLPHFILIIPEAPQHLALIRAEPLSMSSQQPFCLPHYSTKKGEVKQFTHKSPSVCPLVHSTYSGGEVKTICSFYRTPLSKHSLMHIQRFYCHSPADDLTKHPLKLAPRHNPKKGKVDQATAVEGSHCFQWECVSLCSSSPTGVR